MCARIFVCVVAILFSIPTGFMGAEPAPRELSNPQWWFELARRSTELIGEPEDRAMVTQMISGFEGTQSPPENLTQSLEKQRQRYRAELGEDGEWQFELEAARQYEAAQRYGEALEAWKRGKFFAQKRFEEEKRHDEVARARDPKLGAVHWSFRSALDSLASRALHDGHPQVALEAIELFETDNERDMLLSRIAAWQAKADIRAAEATLRRISPTLFARAWRSLLVQQCMEGKREQYERAVHQTIDDRPTMTARDASDCYRMLASTLCAAPNDVDPELLARFSAQIDQDMATATDLDLRANATKCKAALLIFAGRFAEARQLTDHRGKPIVEDIVRETTIRKWIESGKIEEAEKLLPLSQHNLTFVAMDHIKAGRLNEALACIQRFELRGEGYSGYAFDLAQKFAERDDWAGVDRAIATIDHAPSQVRAMGEAATVARRRGFDKQAAALLNRASEVVASVTEIEERKEAAVALAAIYIDDGQLQAAWQIVDRHGDNLARALVLTQIAEKQIAGKDTAGFQASMQRLESLIADKRLYDRLETAQKRGGRFDGPPNFPDGGGFFPTVPAVPLTPPTAALRGGQGVFTPLPVPLVPPDRIGPPIGGNVPIPVGGGTFQTIPAVPVAPAAPAPAAQPPLPVPPKSLAQTLAEIRRPVLEISAEERSQIQIQFALLMGRLYLRSGNKLKAQQAIKAGFERAGEVNGSFWRFELYAELFLENSTPQTLMNMADMLDVVPTPTDRALIACLGGALAAKQQKEAAQPKVTRER